MANYNTFVVVDCTSKNFLTISSARKAIRQFEIKEKQMNSFSFIFIKFATLMEMFNIIFSIYNKFIN